VISLERVYTSYHSCYSRYVATNNYNLYVVYALAVDALLLLLLRLRRLIRSSKPCGLVRSSIALARHVCTVRSSYGGTTACIVLTLHTTMTLLLLLLLLQVLAVGLISALVQNNTYASAALLGVATLALLANIVLQPFANTAVALSEGLLSLADVATMVLVLLCDLQPAGFSTSAASTAVVLLQTCALALVTLFVYADAFVTMFFVVFARVSVCSMLALQRCGVLIC
jgi:hypothetical protein